MAHRFVSFLQRNHLLEENFVMPHYDHLYLHKLSSDVILKKEEYRLRLVKIDFRLNLSAVGQNYYNGDRSNL